jgi:type II secretory pathway pseudopilin PulG
MSIGDRMNKTGLSGQSFRGPSQGFTYIGLLIVVALMGIVLAATGLVWHTEMRREKERELLFAGEQFRRAIAAYYDRSPGEKKWPGKIEDLLQDRRFPTTQRYLRRVYADPMTGSAEWGLVKGPEGEIVGVYSRSEETPIRQANFGSRYDNFSGAQHYSDWKFLFVPDSPGDATAVTSPPPRKD